MSLTIARMSSQNEFINAYIYNSVAFDTQNGAVIDLFYLTEDSKRHILRLYNFDLWFLVCRFPGLSDEEFKSWIRKRVPSNVTLRFRNDLRDNSTFMFDIPYLYAEISATSPKVLKQLHKQLITAARSYYRSLDIDNLSPWDRVLYDNMEDPFRFTNYVLDSDNIKYFLSTTYKIPCIGGVRILKTAMENTYMHSRETPALHVKYATINSLNVNPKRGRDTVPNVNIKSLIEFDQNINFMNHLTLMTYDLETYSQRTDIPEKDKIIMNIGIGFFNILNQTPAYKACLCVKPFTEDDLTLLSDRIAYCYPGNDTLDDYARSHNIDEETVKKIRSNLPIPAKTAKYIRYIVFGEMTNNEASNPNDYTDYVIFNDERSMLMQFMRTIIQKKPDYFGGFNNYGYDDPYIWNRLALYNLQATFLAQLFSVYDTRTIINDESRDHPLLTRSTLPRFEKFQIKIDSMAYPNNETFKGNSTISVDVYKIMLASNAKLYTQLGKGNLKSMLQTNTVKNPYNGTELDKYDLSYVDMFRNWDANQKIYEINHYCMYDAVTCGVLLIKSAQIIDKIEMSTLTDTSVSDSYYRAVTSRILAITNEYAHKLGFAMMDRPVDPRPQKEKDESDDDDSD